MDKRLADRVANASPEGMGVLYASFHGKDGYYHTEYIPDVPYASYGDVTLKLQIIKPIFCQERMPLIVYVQGSAWRKQNIYGSIPSLCNMASRGYVVASVEYRDTDIARFPAQIEDTKAAIRFMRANAEKYAVDTDKVAIWGDSSGGHTALMVGMTPGKFHNGLYGEYSDRVSAIVDFYGVTDIPSLGEFNDVLDHNAPDSPQALLIGGPVPDNLEKAKEASPLYNIPEEEIPPILMVHGDCDGLVHIDQSIRMYKALKEAGKKVIFYKVVGADHGIGVWNKDVLDVTDKFLASVLYRFEPPRPVFRDRG